LSENLSFLIYCHNDIQNLEKILSWKMAADFLCMRSSLLDSVVVTEFQATEAYYSLYLTKAKYSISKLSKVEKENVIARIIPSNFIVCEKRKST
jgi:hypothetical protein